MEAIYPHSYVPKSHTSHKPLKVSASEVSRNEDTSNENEQSGIRGHEHVCGIGHGLGHGVSSTSRGSGLRGRGRG